MDKKRFPIRWAVVCAALLALVTLCAAVGVADEEKPEEATDASGQWLYVLENGRATICGTVEEPIGALVIPATVDGYPVTAIGEDAFYGCIELTSVTLSEGVTDIASGAFWLCDALTRVVLPDSLQHIGDWAFKECTALVSVAFGDGLISIGDSAFFGCDLLCAAALPDGVTRIADYAFLHCGSLADAVLPASVTSIGAYAFHIDDGDALVPNARVTLYVQAGSYAEAYAQAEGLACAPIANTATDAAAEIFARIGGSTFTFASGVGGWATEIVLAPDGSFTGLFTDGDMGDTSDDYPDGTLYVCHFTGRFVVTLQRDAHTYVLRLAALTLAEEPGAERIADGLRTISASAYGMEGGDVFLLYCPGRQTADLPEELMDWLRMPNAWEEDPDTLPCYALYNVGALTGLFALVE